MVNEIVHKKLILNISDLIVFKFRYAKYVVGFDQSGKLLGIIVNFYCDSGNSPNGMFSSLILAN